MWSRSNLHALTAVVGWLLYSTAGAAQPIAQIQVDSQVYTLAFSRDDKLMAVGYLGSKWPVVVWDVTKRKQLHALPSESLGPGRMWFPDAQTLVAAFTLRPEED